MSMTSDRTSRARSMWLPFFCLLLGGVTVHIGGKQPALLYFDLVFGIWVVYQVLWHGVLPHVSGWVVIIGVLCVLFGLLSTLVNMRDLYRGVATTKALAVGIAVYAVAKRAPVSLLASGGFGACASALLLYDYQTKRFDTFYAYTELKDEIEITLGRSNYVASILILLVPLAVAGVWHYKGMKRWICAACAMLMLAGLLATMSRGAILAIVAATILSLPFLKKAGMKISHAVIAVVMICVTLAIVPIDLLESNLALFAFRFENPDYTRIEIIRASWNTFMENPVLGIGPGELGDAINHHMIVPTIAGDRQYNAHNLVIDSLAEMGLPTGLALLAIVGIVLRNAWIAVRKAPSAFNVGVWVALLAGVMHNMVEASFEGPQFQVVFWTVAAMAGLHVLQLEQPSHRRVLSSGPLSVEGTS